MFDAACLLSLYAETPVHAGTGATFGAIDLPVQREKHTNLPVLPASSIKGVMRDVARQRKPHDPRIDEVFGPEKDGNSHAGAISPTDARLLLFPVRSSEGVFVWATCPFILRRLQRDIAVNTTLAAKVTMPDLNQLAVSEGQAIAQAPRPGGEMLILEDDNYAVVTKPEMDALVTALAGLLPDGDEYRFYKTRLKTHLLVLSDDDLIRLATTQTDVVTRNKLNDRKTTTGHGGNMWVQEYVPSDAVFYSLVLAMPSRKEGGTLDSGQKVLKAARDLSGTRHLQIGGDETVGRGWVRTHWIGVPA